MRISRFLKSLPISIRINQNFEIINFIEYFVINIINKIKFEAKVMDIEKEVRKELLNYIERPHTHRPFIEAIEKFPEELINEKPQNVPYTFWQLFEHIRISQFDMVDFMKNAGYKELAWPKDYWPDVSQKADKRMWDDSLRLYKDDLSKLKKIIEDPSTDLFSKIPHGKGQTIFREIIQVIDHESYHMGAFVMMMRTIDAWK